MKPEIVTFLQRKVNHVQISACIITFCHAQSRFLYVQIDAIYEV